MKPARALILFCLFIGLSFAIYYFLNKADIRDKLDKEHRYTISTSVRRLTNSKYGGKNYEYAFSVKGQVYYGRTSADLDEKNDRYFIEYYPPDPEKNNITAVPANAADIANLPPDGYPALPHSK